MTPDNVEDYADRLVKYFRKMCESYQSVHLMHTIGSDFQYQNAGKDFKSMDKIIRYIR